MDNDNKTELRRLADRLGLGEYPVELEAVYEAQKGVSTPACDLTLIDSLQQKYALFGDYYDLVKQSAQQINADPDLNMWVTVAAKFHKGNDKTTACKLPVPTLDGKLVNDFMMLHIMMPMIPDSFQSMEERGFSYEEMADARNAYKGGMCIVKT